MDAIVNVITLLIIAAYVGLLALLFTRSRQISATWRGWLAALVGACIMAAGLYLLPTEFTIAGKPGRNIALMLSLSFAAFCFGVVFIHDMQDAPHQARVLRMWQVICGLWGLGFVISALSGGSFIAGQTEWLVTFFRSPDLSAWVASIGLVAAVLFLLSACFRLFYRAHLPEIANRAMFWVTLTGLLTLGLVFAGTGVHSLALIGFLMLFLSAAGATYALRSYRVFEVRAGLFVALRIIVFVGIAWTMILTALYLIVTTNIRPNEEGLLLMAALAIVVAGLYVPIRQFMDYLIQQLARRGSPDPSQATREYSHAVSEAVELDKLVVIATNALNHVMNVRASCLILLNSAATAKENVELLVLAPDNGKGKPRGELGVHSPIYNTLAVERRPITQFDIEYAPQYQTMSDAQKQFFRELGMSAYVPIVLEAVMIGILACGPKNDDTAYYSPDLELLSSLAQQTGIALRNARLVEDLQHLNKSMQHLNQTLKNANEQLGRMDSVKSDFVTIASHELRTPLAQIRGYTDITEALNEQGLLDQEQTTTMVGNLRKATERMEELISAMLDVSQLDVDAMDLNFTETSILSVVGMAIEPMNESISQRRIWLSAKGLKGLPAIQADLQRLVQAFRNVIVNAVKFTPDGGKIEITGEVQKAQNPDETDYILIKIQDTGVGIAPANLEMIFKKFFRAYDPSLHSTGTYKFLGAGPGLGLTIARGVIEGHGGKIWAESEAHDMENYPGAAFYILLPISTPEDARRTLTFEGNAIAGQAVNMLDAQPEMQ